MSDDRALQILANQLNHTVDSLHRMVTDVQGEMSRSREVVAELRATIVAMEDALHELQEAIHGGPGIDSLAVVVTKFIAQFAELDRRIIALEESFETQEREQEKVYDDRKKFARDAVVQSVPVLLSAVGGLVGYLLAYCLGELIEVLF